MHVPPAALLEQLNLMNGVTRTLINKIVDLTNHDQAWTGVNAEEQAAHWQETAQQQLNQSKMYSVGLHVAMGKFALRMDVVYHLREKKNKQVRDNQQKAMKVWNMHNAMLLEVQQVRAQNKDTHQLTMAS